MKKVLIIYFSGVGSTKKVAELLYRSLKSSQKCMVDIYSLEEGREFHWEFYDALVVGTPVYHAAPSRMVMDFFEKLAPMEKTMPAFLFNTRALWSCNTNRILAKKIRFKNIRPIMDREYRSPASDGVLLAPFIRRFFSFERNLQQKIESDCATFLKLLEGGVLKASLPGFRFSNILNAPNKIAGQYTTFRIYVHHNRCGKCIANCPHHAINKEKTGYPAVAVKICENCYRCIHHCPAKALSLSKSNAPGKVLNFEKLI